MRIATWNLERPFVKGGTTRAQRQVEQILAVDAEIWILTETCAGLQLPGFRSAASPSSLGRYDATESAATVWVPHDWTLQVLAESTHSVCVRTDPPGSNSSLIVYGSIIPYHMAGGRPWEMHIAEARRQTDELERLARLHPESRIIYAGDFNMTLNSDAGYGRAEGRRIIRDACSRLGLKCPTAVDIRAAEHGAIGRDNIDHICVDERLGPIARTGAWPATIDGHRLSDHNGMFVDISY